VYKANSSDSASDLTCATCDNWLGVEGIEYRQDGGQNSEISDGDPAGEMNPAVPPSMAKIATSSSFRAGGVTDIMKECAN